MTRSTGCVSNVLMRPINLGLFIGHLALRMVRIKSRRNGQTDTKANLMMGGTPIANVFLRKTKEAWLDSQGLHTVD